MEFWWIPLKGEWMDLHRKCKNKKTKNITCWGINFIKNWCFSKFKISQHFVNPFIPLLIMLFSKILKLLILSAKILFLVSKSIFFSNRSAIYISSKLKHFGVHSHSQNWLLNAIMIENWFNNRKNSIIICQFGFQLIFFFSLLVW